MENIDNSMSKRKRRKFEIVNLNPEPEFILGDNLELTHELTQDTGNAETADFKDVKLYAECKIYLEKCDGHVLYPRLPCPNSQVDDKNILQELVASIQPEKSQELSKEDLSKSQNSVGIFIKKEPPAEPDDCINDITDDVLTSKQESAIPTRNADGTSVKEEPPVETDDLSDHCYDEDLASKEDSDEEKKKKSKEGSEEEKKKESKEDSVGPTEISNGTKTSRTKTEQKCSGTRKIVEINEPNSSISCKQNVMAVKHTDDIFCKCVQCNELLLHNAEAKSSQESTKQKSHLVFSKNFKCNLCSKVFNRESVLKEHQYTKCRTLKLYGCSLCSKGFYTKKGLKSHIKMHHTEKRNKFKCDICNKSFVTESLLKRHIKTVHGKHFGKPEQVACEVCNKLCNNKRSLNNHFHRMHALGQFECGYCGKIYKYKTVLIDHIQNHMGIQKYKCSICKRSFNTENKLEHHLEAKSCFTQQFVCDICGKVMKRKMSLDKHILIHYDKKPFVCDNCGKCFRSKSNLDQHSVTHSNIRPFKCDLCDKAFRLRNHLRQHMAVHGMTTTVNYRKRNWKPAVKNSDIDSD